MSLLPLQNSHTVGDIESELKALMVDLYATYQKEIADEINVYGMPHLGSFKLIERLTTQDGLVMLRQNSEDAMRYLYKAWRGRNPERGFHFLNTYLQVLWGEGNYFINQLWQSKVAPYPKLLRSYQEIAWDYAQQFTYQADYVEQGYAVDSVMLENDWFLTSRVRVDVDTDRIPDNIVTALKSVVPARILVKLRVAKFGKGGFNVAGVIGADNLMFASGNGIQPTRDRFGVGGFNDAGVFGASSVFVGSGEAKTRPDLIYGEGSTGMYGSFGVANILFGYSET